MGGPVVCFGSCRVRETLVLVTSAIPFGVWVRRRRRALDLTQQQLGTLVGCATITVRKVEAGGRLLLTASPLSLSPRR